MSAPAPETPAPETRCGFVALIGAPNAGKSTLLNALVGSKVSIVSRKVQTTRALVRGIAIEGAAQIVFVDTPGIFAPKRRLDRAMVTSAWGGAGDADVVCLLVDVRKGVDEEDDAILAKLPEVKRPKILILNKIDLIERPKLLELAAALNARLPFERVFMVSALTGDGVGDLKRSLAAMMPAGPWLYPEDQISDAPLRMLAAEITREKIYERLHEELPYRSTVETDQWQARDGRLGAHRADDLRRAREPAEDRARQGRPDHQGDRPGGPQGHRRDRRGQGPPLPVRQGARELGRRSRALPRDGAGVPKGMSPPFTKPERDG